MYNLIYNNHRITFGNVNVGIELPHATITYSTVEHGTLTGVDTALIGSIVTVTAIPSTGYSLSYITVNGTQIEGNSFVVTENTTVGAVFTGIIRSVTTTSSPVAGGSITASPSTGIIGTEVTLSNTPAEGYNFNGYVISGATLSGNTFTISDSDVSVTGKFMVANGYYYGEATVGYYGNLSGNTVSGIPIYGNYNYYVPVKANLSGPYSSAGAISNTIYNQRAFVFMNDNGADAITSLSLTFNESSALVIGDNTLNNLTSISFNSLNRHNPLYIGNNSMNLTNTTQVNLTLSNMDQMPVYIGDGSCNNFNLTTAGNAGPIKVGNNSLRTLTLKQDIRYYLSSGNFGAHLDVRPLIIDGTRVNLYGDIKSMVVNSCKARGIMNESGRWLLNNKYLFTASSNVDFTCPDISSEDRTWLNNNARWFISGNYTYRF